MLKETSCVPDWSVTCAIPLVLVSQVIVAVPVIATGVLLTTIDWVKSGDPIFIVPDQDEIVLLSWVNVVPSENFTVNPVREYVSKRLVLGGVTQVCLLNAPTIEEVEFDIAEIRVSFCAEISVSVARPE